MERPLIASAVLALGLLAVSYGGLNTETAATKTPADTAKVLSDIAVATTSKAKAAIKADYTAKFATTTSFAKDNIRVEITKIEKIDGGVQVFARAWKNGKQLGFGADGTTDIERFRIFNPPILVSDLNGDIVREYTDSKGVTHQLRYREDAQQALEETLAHTILVSGRTDTKIRAGSIGNTTDTFYADASGDGSITMQSATWSTRRSGGGSQTALSTVATREDNYEDTNYTRQIWYPFDTSSIPAGATISAATFSPYYSATNVDNTMVNDVCILKSSQASLTALAYSDWVPPSYTEIATRKAWSGLGAAGYKDFSITDLTVIAKGSGFTPLLLTDDRIVDDAAPTTDDNLDGFYMSDQTGTTNDPKLVVTYTVAAAVLPAAANVMWLE